MSNGYISNGFRLIEENVHAKCENVVNSTPDQEKSLHRVGTIGRGTWMKSSHTQK